MLSQIPEAEAQEDKDGEGKSPVKRSYVDIEEWCNVLKHVVEKL